MIKAEQAVFVILPICNQLVVIPGVTARALNVASKR